MKKTKQSRLFLLAFVFMFSGHFVYAQETQNMASDVEQLQSDIAVAKKLKVTGYVQAQYQKVETAGVKSVAGGDFGSNVDNRMMVRRGRVKVAYDNEFSQAVVQFDVTEKGLGIKDAYLNFTDRWIKSAALTGGVFNRPFGYEIAYSSSLRESPERARITQTLFPGERDLGGMLTLQAPKTSSFNFLKLEAGLFNGNGTNVETDKYKDLIGHLSATKVSSNERFKWGVGVSYYNGGFALSTTNVYSVKEVGGVKAFAKDSTQKKGSKAKREYIGVDAQLSYDWFPGITQIRAEYLQGTQPATSSSSGSLTAASSGDAYSRMFNGFYVYVIQNILQTPLQAVVKYDVYDPNMDLSGNKIGKTTGSNSTDVKYSTLGFGLNYRWNSNVKIMAYYDVVRNEKSTQLVDATNVLNDFSKDIKDNVFTLRLQYKF